MPNGRLSNNNDSEYEEKKGQNRLYKKKVDRQNGHQVAKDELKQNKNKICLTTLSSQCRRQIC